MKLHPLISHRNRRALARSAIACAVAGCLAGPLQAAEGPVLRYGIEMELATLDPVRVSNNWETMAAVNLYDTLVFPDPEQGLIPRIAESWEVSEDKKTYTFKLRDGIPFHDGSLITAEDVVFSMQRTLAMPGLSGGYLRNVDPERLEVLDPQTVRFHLNSPDPAFLRALLHMKVLNKKLITANLAEGSYGELGDYGARFLLTNDAGSGPYMLTAFRAGDVAVMTRFEDYPFADWKPNSPHELRLQIVPEAVTNITKLRAGELDAGPLSMAPQILKPIDSDPRMTVEKHAQLATYYVTMNNTRPPLDDVHVRRAISYAYDVNTVMNHILSGGTPVAGPVPGQLLGDCEGIPSYAFDLEKAQAELAKSKYSAAQLKAFNLDIAAVSTSEPFKNIALMLSTTLRKIGLNASVKPARWADIVQAATKPDTAFDMAIYYDSARLGHPSQLMMYYTESGWGAAYPGGGIYWSSSEVDTLLSEAAMLDDNSPEQKRAYCEANKLIAADAPAIFSHSALRTLPHWNYVKGFRADAGAPFFDLRFEGYEFDLDDPAYVQNHGRSR
ncbi:ABC transporter substrate-binding protein [Verticiella sediminum]|uniref:ABC transporter substrate-binding protein n=1 Tax=Verticiella sediminum TaxID=1247510 RepID=A0A556AGW4_9BURK|nr:ABC transporter substrate-binding protein [Verticiella sediminum]TSH92138.1 ABC transporter substrate-binding protein [Verticiella sediminum]